MNGSTAHERIDAARSLVLEARALLAQPAGCDLDRCGALFREVQQQLEEFCRDFPRDPAGARLLRSPAAGLRDEIRQAGALLEQAARFGRDWLARWSASQGGYTPAGAPAPIPSRCRISIAG